MYIKQEESSGTYLGKAKISGPLLAILLAVGVVVFSAAAQEEPTSPLAPKAAQTLTSEQERRAKILGGELQFEQDAKIDPLKFGQQEAEKYINAALQSAKGFANISPTTPIPQPDERAIDYYAVSYLFCTARLGTCPQMLNALLEIDLINAKITNNIECPLLTKFWQVWLKGGYEERQKYLVQTSHMKEYGDFNSKERPRYIQCKDTVATEVKNSSNVDSTFWTRYATNAIGLKNIEKALTLLEFIKSKVGDPYTALGIKAERIAAEDGKGVRKN